MKVPQQGFTLEQVCKIAADEGVGIQIGISPENVGLMPQRITIAVYDPNKATTTKPVAFEMDLLKLNTTLNQQLSRGLMQFIERVKPRRMRLMTGKE